MTGPRDAGGRPDAQDEPAHDHDHDHDHDHGHGSRGWRARLAGLFVPHSHDAALAVDHALDTSHRGNRALVVSLVGLGVAAGIQGGVVVVSGSVALFGDALHNVADALTALPLGVAFWLGRRPPTRRYTYGYGRAEDLAGVAVVAVIAASSVLTAYLSVRRLTHGAPVRHLWAVAVAAVVGFAGNELVARYRIRVGREIGSAALVADGLHARADGLTSLSVLLAAGGVALGWRAADPVIGLLITLAIVLVLRDAAREVYRRLMDAVDPALVDQVTAVLRSTPGVLAVGETRLRWIGHRLRAECQVVVDHDLSVVDGHRIAVECEHALLHELPRLTAALVHADPFPHGGVDHHELTAHHRAGQGRP